MVIGVTAGTGTTLAKLVEYALAEVQDGLYAAHQRGVPLLMPEYIDFEVTVVSGGGLNAYSLQSTQAEPETTTTQTAQNPEVTRTESQTHPTRTTTTTPSGQQTVMVKTGGDQTVTEYDYTE